MRKLLILVSLINLSVAYAQVGGKHAYQFLEMPTSPKLAALGGVNVTITGVDVNQVLFNPASLSDEMNGMLGVNFGSYYGDVSLGSAAYAHKFKNGRNMHVGVTYLNYGSMDGYDENGIATGTFSGNDIAVSIGYAHPFEGTNFSIGANIKAVSSTLESYNSMALAADIGGIYNDSESGWTVGLTFNNIGTQLSNYEDMRETLPFKAVLGFSKLLENVPIRWHLTFDNLQKWDISFSNPNRSQTDLENNITEENITFGNNLMRHVVLGVELFPEKNFNIRVGYNFKNGMEMKLMEQRHFAGFTAGFGLQVKRFKIAYAYNRFTLAGNSNLFGVSVKL